MTHDVFGSLMQNIRENECVQLQDDLFNTVSVKIGKNEESLVEYYVKKDKSKFWAFITASLRNMQQGRRDNFESGGTSSRAERAKKIFLDPPTFCTWGDIKQDITVFITAIMTHKRLCLPAPNNYNIGLCDYCGYGETETVKECHF